MSTCFAIPSSVGNLLQQWSKKIFLLVPERLQQSVPVHFGKRMWARIFVLCQRGRASVSHNEPEWASLSHNEPEWARVSQREPDCMQKDTATELGWARVSQGEPGWASANPQMKLCQELSDPSSADFHGKSMKIISSPECLNECKDDVQNS